MNYICDICGISTSVSNNGVYDDTECNFGLCEGCHKDLPETFDQSQPRGLIANKNTHCSCGAVLIYINAVHNLKPCSLCQVSR